MRKIASILIATTMLLGLFISTTQAQETKQIGWVVAGTVTQNNSDNLVLKVAFQEFMTAKVLVNADTNYRDLVNKPEGEKEALKITQSDIKVGDKVICNGLMTIVQDGDSTFTAKNVIKIKTFPKLQLPQPPKDDRGQEKRPEVMGIFKSYADNKITLTTPNGEKEFTLEVNDKTKYLRLNKGDDGKKKEEIKIGDLKPGDKLLCIMIPVKPEEGEEKGHMVAGLVQVVDEFPVKQPQPPRDDRRGENQKPQLMGIFKSLEDGKLNLTSPDGKKEFQIEVNEKTKYVKVNKGDKENKREQIKPEDLKPGDKLVCTMMPVPPKEGEENVIPIALIVVVVDEFPEPRPPQPQPQPKEIMLIGTFKAVEGEYLVVVPKNTDKAKEIKFAFNDKTKFVYIPTPAEGEKPEPVQKTLEDLKPGQKVMIGTTPVQEKDGVFYGRAIIVRFLDEFPPERNSGEIQEISANSLTIKMPERKNLPEKILTFTINKDTKFFICQRGEKPQEASKSDFKKGDVVDVEHRDGVALVVRKIMLEKKD